MEMSKFYIIYNFTVNFFFLWLNYLQIPQNITEDMISKF